MTTEWTPMEPDSDNHADLFGGDLFSDELLDIYNSEGVNDASGHDGVVPLANGESIVDGLIIIDSMKCIFRSIF